MKEIVIKLSDTTYKNTLTHGGNSNLLVDAIRNGKVLPKGHGRLIDADKYVKSICDNCDGYCECVGCDCLNCHSDRRCEFTIAMDTVDAVVEADKGEE